MASYADKGLDEHVDIGPVGRLWQRGASAIRYILLMEETEPPTLLPRHEPEIAELPVVAEHGVVYTRPWVVNLVLDLAGYTSDHNLVDLVAVEPCCGNGEFLEPMIRRLSYSCRQQGRPLIHCEASLKAFDVSHDAVVASRERATSVLRECGWSNKVSREMAERWIHEADFLLDAELDMIALGGGVNFVIGNPPYVRVESINEEVARTYRKRYETMSHRADLYIGFFERALEALTPGGVCAFICADRWMLNQYGSRLRSLITTGGFSVETVVEMYGADAFHDKVLAYPAITSIRKAEDQGRVLVAEMSGANEEAVDELTEAAARVHASSRANADRRAEQYDSQSVKYAVVDEWFEDADPWPRVSPDRLKLLRRLESEFQALEHCASSTRVGIGIATGADKVFLTKNPELVEAERLLPMAMAKDTTTGRLEWSGHYLVNPWEVDGSLVDLARYPLLRGHFEEHEDVLRKRHVGQRDPLRWYKTIDKVNHALTAKPKLLIPDIKSVAHPVYDEGYYYPHHNLYYIVSDTWDLKVLGGLLLSAVGQLFIECYAVRMSGGYLRFQAQYLRRIRVPRPDKIAGELAEMLSQAFESRDTDAATAAALEVYGIGFIPK